MLDVGCGPGALTAELVRRLGPDGGHGGRSVGAVRRRGARAASGRQRASARRPRTCPFPDGTFDAALAQLVVHFMTDPVAGLREMARVTREDGVVAACVWDHAGRTGPALRVLGGRARARSRTSRTSPRSPGAREGHLGELFDGAGLRDVEEARITVSVEHPSFEEWWEPFTLGVGPAGDHAAGLDPERQAALRESCRAKLPPAPFVATVRAWSARGRA